MSTHEKLGYGGVIESITEQDKARLISFSNCSYKKHDVRVLCFDGTFNNIYAVQYLTNIHPVGLQWETVFWVDKKQLDMILHGKTQPEVYNLKYAE